MLQPIGEFIRQARRQQNITQTELGGKHFSKSYVSAVERNKIVSSTEALRFFAEQLGQPSDYFISLLQQVGSAKPSAVLNGPGLPGPNERAFPDEVVTLLDILLENTELYDLPVRYELPKLSPEVIVALPPAKQAHYHFLMGLIAKGKQDSLAARQAFESALALAPASLQVAILDELGVNYYSTGAYQTALGYQLRALHLLRNASFSDRVAALEFKVELHCGDDYRALGEYKRACEHYERARSQLSSEHDMKTAGLLYWKLGYCTYAAIHQDTALSIPADKRATAEAMECEFQRAVGFLLQSRILYQVCSDKMQEARARLAQALTLLDFCNRRRQMALLNGKSAATLSIANSISLLGEAEEQCRQVLMSWQNAPGDAVALPSELDAIIYVALAYLIRVFVERASLARLNGHKDTAFREQAMASYLCQQVLDSFSGSALPWAVMRKAGTLQSANIVFQPPSLPRFPDLSNGHNPSLRSPLSQVEVYFAVGEVAEGLGLGTTEENYAHNCYTLANRFYQTSLSIARSLIQDKGIEPDYITRCYQRCICLLEERMLVAPGFSADTDRMLLDVLEEAFHHLQYSAIFPIYKVAG